MTTRDKIIICASWGFVLLFASGLTIAIMIIGGAL